MKFIDFTQQNVTLLENVKLETKIRTQALLLENSTLSELLGVAQNKIDRVDAINARQILDHCQESVSGFIDGKINIKNLLSLEQLNEEKTKTLNDSLKSLEAEYVGQISILATQLQKIQNIIMSKIQNGSVKNSLIQSKFLERKFANEGVTEDFMPVVLQVPDTSLSQTNPGATSIANNNNNNNNNHAQNEKTLLVDKNINQAPEESSTKEPSVPKYLKMRN